MSWRSWFGPREIVVLVLFVAVLMLPLLFRIDRPETNAASRTLVIMTPHNEQIRYEFKRAFELWHERTYGEQVRVAWSVPGGTSEIRRMLMAQWTAALEQGFQPGGDADLVFGGGSYEHGRLRSGVSETIRHLASDSVLEWLAGIEVQNAQAVMAAAMQEGRADFAAGVVHGVVSKDQNGDTYTIKASATISTPSQPVENPATYYGRTEVADTPLWNRDGYWWGTALSSFGIIANLDELKVRHLEPPNSWRDLADPMLLEAVSMVNPAQSGSVTTAFDTILRRFGWTAGWQVLRRMAANARTISASSLRGPTDVAAGDAAMGVCIDFFGRYQEQALADHGAAGRVMYIDPPGETTLDPDPISMLASPPDRELALRFIEFTLSDEGQSLWQFDPKAASPDGLGPEQYALRRLPIITSMYTRFDDRFMDTFDPFANAGEVEFPDNAMRAFIAPLMQAMAFDRRDDLVAAWVAITSHPDFPTDREGVIVTADMVDDPELKAMLVAFDAMPPVHDPDGNLLSLDTKEGREAIKRGWLRGGWGAKGPWDPESSPASTFRRHAGRFFSESYQDVISGGARTSTAAAP